MAQIERESFIRWQEITRSQFSAVANFILALATGLLAFQTNLMLDNKLVSSGAYGFALISLIVLAISVVSGLWCSVNRLLDFRLTTKIALNRKNSEVELQDLRDESKVMGRFTWQLLWTQISLFGLGAICMVVAVTLQIWPM